MAGVSFFTGFTGFEDFLQKPHTTAIYWFRRSLRLDDNRALSAAVQAADHVVPLFILDPDILEQPHTSATRTRFLLELLGDIHCSLKERGGRLILRRGEPAVELAALVKETGATALFYGRDYTPYSRQRDGRVEAAMASLGVTVQTESDHLIAEPEDIRTHAGGVYTVFTPYKRVWFERPVDTPSPAIAEHLRVPEGLSSVSIPESAKAAGVMGAEAPDPPVKGTEAEGLRLLDTFVTSGVAGYDEERDFPGREGTSRLSAYLRMGAISPRRLFEKVREGESFRKSGEGSSHWLSELAWRDFYYQILWHHPHAAKGAFRKKYDGIAWENDPALFAAWCEGRTGYPFVDAAQRQLSQTGWMHNRARMVTASFLTKDLLCDWRKGEWYFMECLIDGDPASNNGGWQWAAGTGTDAQPYFRIFNPVTQGEKFDPDGNYVRKWVPELKRVPAKFIQRPWDMPPRELEAAGCMLGRDYPYPVVDHKVQRERALAMYRRAGNGETE